MKRKSHWPDIPNSNRNGKQEVIDVDYEAKKEHKEKRKDAMVATALMNTNLSIRMGQTAGIKRKYELS